MDYDGDGLLDLISGCACCEHAQSFYFFRRLKSGGFAARQRIQLDYPTEEFALFDDLPLTGLKSKPAVVDWNGDGVPDLLVGGNTHVLGVVLGPLAGKETLTVERVWPKGKEPFHAMTTNLCVADWDGDGLADVVVGGSKHDDEKRGVYWLRNIGTRKSPKLAEPKLLTVDEQNLSTTGVWVADWNADGRPDLIASRQGQSKVAAEHKVWVYLRQVR